MHLAKTRTPERFTRYAKKQGRLARSGRRHASDDRAHPHCSITMPEYVGFRAMASPRTYDLGTSKVATLPKLLAAAPIVALSEELTRHVSDLSRLAPASDATTALTLYRDKLAAAVQRARELELFLSAEAAALILGKSISAITYLCRTGALKAKKVGGTWQIDRVDLERLRDDYSRKRQGASDVG